MLNAISHPGTLVYLYLFRVTVVTHSVTKGWCPVQEILLSLCYVLNRIDKKNSNLKCGKRSTEMGVSGPQFSCCSATALFCDPCVHPFFVVHPDVWRVLCRSERRSSVHNRITR